MREPARRPRRAPAGGERQIGWKVGFGAPAALEKLAHRPPAGRLPDRQRAARRRRRRVGRRRGRTRCSSRRSPCTWRATCRAARSWDDVRDAIGGLSAAIELADLDPPPEDVRAILAGNIFHRHVVLGPVDPERSTGEGIGARVLVDGDEVAATDDPAALTGELVEVVRLTAELLDAVRRAAARRRGRHHRLGRAAATGCGGAGNSGRGRPARDPEAPADLTGRRKVPPQPPWPCWRSLQKRPTCACGQSGRCRR